MEISTFFGSCYDAWRRQRKKKLFQFCRFNLNWKRKKWIPNIVCWCISQQYYNITHFSLLSHTFRCDFEQKKNNAKTKLTSTIQSKGSEKIDTRKAKKIEKNKICACEYRIKWQEEEEEEQEKNNNKISYKKKDIEREWELEAITWIILATAAGDAHTRTGQIESEVTWFINRARVIFTIEIKIHVNFMSARLSQNAYK